MRLGATHPRGAQALAVSTIVIMGTTGLAACGDSEGPEQGVTTEDLTALQDEVAALDQRVSSVEQNLEGSATGDQGGQEIVGQEVTVSAEVSEVITSNDAGGAFRIAGDAGPSVAVLSTTPPEDLGQNDVVQVTGTVQIVNRDSFEADFGIAEDDLFDDPDSFFGVAEGNPAIAATNIEVIEEGQ